jgi:hypothetical protein
VRTTVSIDDDVAALLKKEVRKSGEPFKQVINRCLRLGLTVKEAPRKPFRVKPLDLRLPEFTKVEELLEWLEGPEHR